jgi:hypothetical protein
MIGRLDQLIIKAEAEAPPQIGAAAMHPLIWGAAGRLWRDRHFRQAVSAAAEAPIAQVKTRTDRNDVSDTALWQETFSDKDPLPGKPRLRWPGNPADRDVKSVNDGLRQLAPGLQMTIRNPAARSRVAVIDEGGKVGGVALKGAVDRDQVRRALAHVGRPRQRDVDHPVDGEEHGGGEQDTERGEPP